jgi:hypothetical protein
VARELLASLDAEQRRVAVIADVAPPDFVLANAPAVPETAAAAEFVPSFMRRVREINEAWETLPADAAEALRFHREQPCGIAATALRTEQRALISALVDVYVSRLNHELGTLAAQETASQIDGLHFAWAGSDRPREGHYYRLQGPRFLVEYDNTQDGANHVHAVWRDMYSDFGMDVLRLHTRSAH